MQSLASVESLFAGGDAASGHSLSSLALHEDMPATSTNKAYIDFSAYVDVAATGNTHLQTSGGAPQSATHPSMTTPAMRSPAAMNVSSASAMSDAETSLALWQATGGAFGGLNDLSTTNFAMDTSVAIPPNTDQSALGLSTFFSPLSFFGHQLKEQDNLISYEMYIKVAYRGCAMAAMRIAHRDGCRLFYGSPPPRNTLDVATQERLFGPRKLMQLSLPAPRTAQSMLQSMWMVLEATQRGLILEMENNDIYATRLCCACVYFANQEGEVVALKRKERTQIFCFATFQKTYQRYKDPHHSHRLVAGEAPCYEVLMSIGQHWGEERHRDNNLISLNITHSLGEKMIESLRQEFFKNQNPFDTDYMSVDEMDEDDKRAKAALAAALQGTLHKSLESTSNHAASRNRGAGPKPAASMRKSKEKRQQSKQLARSVRQPPIPIPAK